VKSEDAVKMAQQLALKEGLLVSHRQKKMPLLSSRRMKNRLLMQLLANVK
jgi:hypothetical protein